MPENHRGTSALLDLAADLMEEHGWRTDEYFSVPPEKAITDDANYVGGAMCTEGAIRAASTIIWMDDARSDHRNPFGRRKEVLEALEVVRELAPYTEDAPIEAWSIPWWNDTKCCSKEEAVTLLRNAAIKTRPDSA